MQERGPRSDTGLFPTPYTKAWRRRGRVNPSSCSSTFWYCTGRTYGLTGLCFLSLPGDTRRGREALSLSPALSAGLVTSRPSRKVDLHRKERRGNGGSMRDGAPPGGGEWRGPSAPYASDAEAVPYSSEQEAFRRLRHSPGCVRKGSAPARGRETPREGGGGSGWRRGDIGWWWKGISLSRPRPWPALVSLTQGQSKRLQQEVSSPSPSGSLGPKRGGRWWSLLLLLRSKLSSDLFVFWAMMWTGPLVSSLVAGEIRSESHSRRRPQSGSSSLFAKLTHFFVDLFLLFLSSPSLLP